MTHETHPVPVELLLPLCLLCLHQLELATSPHSQFIKKHLGRAVLIHEQQLHLVVNTGKATIEIWI